MTDLYTLMLNRRLTSSQRHFSSYWCERAPNYLALQNGISASVMITVFRNLVTEGRWLMAFRVAHMILFGTRSR